MSEKILPIALGVGIAIPAALFAPVSALTFLGGSGFWSNPVGPGTSIPGNVVFENIGGPYPSPQPITLPSPNNVSPSGVRWGTTAGDKSGLRSFGSIYSPGIVVPTDGTSVTATNIFILDHINFPIAGGSQLTSINWTVSLNFLDESNNPFNVTTVIPVSIDETPNVTPCAYTAPPPNTPCPDRITLTQPNAAIVGIPGTTEFINLQLQFPSTGTNFLTTNENQQNLFPINGIFTRVPATAPLGALGIFSILAGSYKALKKRYSTIISRQN